MGEVSSVSFLPQTAAQWYWSFSVLGFFLCAAFGWVVSRFGRSRRGKITYREPDRFDRWLFWGMAVVFGLVVLIGYPPPAQAHDGCSIRDGGNRGWIGGAWNEVYHTPDCGPIVRNEGQYVLMQPRALAPTYYENMSCQVFRVPNSCSCTIRPTGAWNSIPTTQDLSCTCTPSAGSGRFTASECDDFFEDHLQFNRALLALPECPSSYAGLDHSTGHPGDSGCDYFGDALDVDGALWSHSISFGAHTGGNNPRPTALVCSEPHGGYVKASSVEFVGTGGQDYDLGHWDDVPYACVHSDHFSHLNLDTSTEVDDANFGSCNASIQDRGSTLGFTWYRQYGCAVSSAHADVICPSECRHDTTDPCYCQRPSICSSKSVGCTIPQAFNPDIHALDIPCSVDDDGVRSCLSNGSTESVNPILLTQQLLSVGVFTTGVDTYYVGFYADIHRPSSGKPYGCACDLEDTNSRFAAFTGDTGWAPLSYLSEGSCRHTHESTSSDVFDTFQVNSFIEGSYCPDELADTSGRDSIVYTAPSSGRVQWDDGAGSGSIDDEEVPLSCLRADTSLCTYEDVLVTLDANFDADCGRGSGSQFQLPGVIERGGDLSTDDDDCPVTDNAALKSALALLTAAAVSLGYGHFYGIQPRPTHGLESGLPADGDQFGEIGKGNPLQNLGAPELLQRAFPAWYLIDDIAEDPRAISLMFTHPVVSSVQVDTALTYVEYMSEYFSKPFNTLINPFSQNLHAWAGDSARVPPCPRSTGNIELDGVADIGLQFSNPHDEDEPYVWSYGRGVTLSFGDLVCGFVEPAGPWIRNITYMFFIVFILWSTFGMVRGRM